MTNRRVSCALCMAMVMLLPGSRSEAQESPAIQVGEDQETLSILRQARYRYRSGKPAFAPRTAAEFSAFFGSPGWKPTSYSHQGFGTGPEVLWLRLEINYRPPADAGTNRIHRLVQQYAWINHFTAFHLRPNGRLVRLDGGDMIPYAKRRPTYRLPTVSLRLEPGLNRVLLRIQSGTEKIIGLNLRGPGGSPGTLASMHIIVLGAVLIAGFISILIAVTLRETFALYYLAYLVSMAMATFAWEGYGHRLLYPSSPELNDPLVLALSFLLMFSVLQFWKKLLLMPLQFPLMNRICNIFGWCILAMIPCVFIPSESLAVWENTLSIVMISTNLLLLWSGFYAIRRRFTPAYLSLIGILLFTLGLLIMGFSGVWIIPGNAFTRESNYIFYLVEFSFFLASMVVRIRFLARIAIQAGYDPAVPRLEPNRDVNIASGVKEPMPEVSPPKSRLEGNDIRVLSERLNHLLQGEKLFADEDLNQERLAGLLGLTRHQMSELFRITYRGNYHQTMNRLRVEEARDLLRAEPERNILSIALAVGYSSKSTFNAEFRKRMGVSPSEYRKHPTTAGP